MNTIISGSRRITDIRIVEEAIRASGFKISLVIEGGQRMYDDNDWPVGGVDYLAQLWAIRNKIPCHTERADWPKYRKKAGPIRNRKMAAIARQLIAIPDPESTGTVDMIEAARKAGFAPDRIYVHYDPDLFPEGPTGCLDDNDALAQALRRMAERG